MTHPTHYEPTDPADMTEEQYQRWCDEHDNRYAEVSCAATPNEPAEVANVVTPARVLRDAAVYLARHGWTQGSYYDTTDVVFTPAACLVGALGMVCYGGPVDAPALNHYAPEFADFSAAMDYLGNYLAWFYGVDAYTFNDAKGRTATQVSALLSEVADSWDLCTGNGFVHPERLTCGCFTAAVLDDDHRTGCEFTAAGGAA